MDHQSIDYSKYTLDELRDVQRHISREKYPERARFVDAELARRAASEEAGGTSSQETRGRRNTAVIAGVVIISIAIAQFLVFVALDAAGVIDIGNGLGCGLVMWFGAGIGFVVASIGTLLHRRK
jgi:hypothetical protein